jgi:hypothetical protein
MMGNGRPKTLSSVFVVLGVVLVAVLIAAVIHFRKPITLRGAIIKEDADTRRQSPIENVEVSTVDGMTVASAKSDFSGYFKLTLPRGTLFGHAVTLQFRHPDFQPFDLKEAISDKLYVIRMTPVHPDADAAPDRSAITVANISVRYSIETTTTLNVGTGIKTFQIENTGNVRCDRKPPCSPDGKWKGAVASASLDAGELNEYENARVSCIAGPCPFTKIVSDNFSAGGRKISVSVLDWSGTTTFLLQAEVFRREISDIVRESYPVIFGQAINFTLPAAAEGPSLEAEINGVNIVFPLGPAPTLSWATCNVRMGKDQSKTYRCELKPAYRFR